VIRRGVLNKGFLSLASKVRGLEKQREDKGCYSPYSITIKSNISNAV